MSRRKLILYNCTLRNYLSKGIRGFVGVGNIINNV